MIEGVAEVVEPRDGVDGIGPRDQPFAAEFAERYRQLISAHRDELERSLGANQIDYIFTDISQPLDQVLFRYLSDRARQIMTR